MSFKSLFEKYKKGAGMDQASKELLKRYLFVQALAYKLHCHLLPAFLCGGDHRKVARESPGSSVMIISFE